MTAEYINAHESIYNYLIRYFLPDLSDPYFRQDAAHEIEQDERMTYCRYMAAWLPYEPHYNEILKQIERAARRANEKEDAVEHPLFFIISYAVQSTVYNLLHLPVPMPNSNPVGLVRTE